MSTVPNKKLIASVLAFASGTSVSVSRAVKVWKQMYVSFRSEKRDLVRPSEDPRGLTGAASAPFDSVFARSSWSMWKIDVTLIETPKKDSRPKSTPNVIASRLTTTTMPKDIANMGSTYVDKLEDTQRDLASYFDKSAAVVRSNFAWYVELFMRELRRNSCTMLI